VPGQFSEWFDGESLINRGMRLSPWEPPRFLWAAVEGVCGMMLTNGAPSINPLVPPTWKWVALKQCPYHREHFSFFAVKQKGEFHVHATCVANTQTECLTYEEDISNGVLCFSNSAAVVALRRGNMMSLMVGNVGDQTASVPINLKSILDPQITYKTRSYDSERDEWEDKGTALGVDLVSLAISIETNGYRLIELTEI
jgi:hypothetical protein